MKKFLVNILIFGLGLVIANLIIYRYIVYDLLYKEYELEIEELQTYQNFIFSDSHGWRVSSNNEDAKQRLAAVGIANFSFGSDSYCDMYLKLQFLINNKLELKTIYLTVDDHTLSKYRAKNNNKNRSVSYVKYQNFAKAYRENLVEFMLRKYALRYLPTLYKSNQGLIKEYLFAGSFDLPNRRPMVKSWNDLDIQEKKENAADKAKNFFPSEKPSSLLQNCLEQIIALSEHHDIKIVGVKFPLSPTFVEYIDDRSYGADSLLLARGYKILDFKNYFKEEHYFANEDHVNSIGGLAFVEQLVERLKSAE